MTTSKLRVSKTSIRKANPRFQQTFQTPVNGIGAFAATIVSAGQIQGGSFGIDLAVFEPKNLINLLERYALRLPDQRGPSITAAG